ncbi:DUF1648 domain-containing protein [Streptococcus mitis]|jgi:hypothetical protein|uniref:DUF1648 domain-containing protein n=1 Tax=Streptococcus mitis TaxID=28037 RepID=A0A1X1JV89_STRMT|nr:DUF1648 domain-containing protein [Streptococcus mitis]MBS5367035.1 DUF1648 domain-containing protein [Streptococcus mitis]MQP82331.1 DUF1648 domain-containing protein [Streptococcus mitis]MQQ40254.1 DUF1648 domain-containing protein [Streptococcus mitis]MQQ61277.1 DUF1648 domain-containing protein [Streptococcus mitis]ORO91080.1 hypothetical protein B7701_01230 [Streptococcus mitis]
MKNRLIKDILVLLVMLAIIVVICIFLPEKIPVHFNAKGVADMFANKYYLLFATVIPYSAYWKFIRGRKNKQVK